MFSVGKSASDPLNIKLGVPRGDFREKFIIEGSHGLYGEGGER